MAAYPSVSTPTPDALFGSAPLGLFHADLTGICTMANSCLCALTGHLAEELRGRSWFSLLHPEDRQRVSSAWRQAVEDQGPLQAEFRLVRKDRRVLWCRGRTVPLLSPEGQITGFLGAVEDISQERLLEERARHQFFFLQSLERISTSLHRAQGLEEMMAAVLETVLMIFQCDRAWLLFPCTAEKVSLRVAMERTAAGRHPVFPPGKEIPLLPEARRLLQEILAAPGPVACSHEQSRSLPPGGAAGSLRDRIVMALRPRIGLPWILGVDLGCCPSPWSAEEHRLFAEIGRRITDGLSNQLLLRDAEEREKKYRELVEGTDDVVIRLNREMAISFVNGAGAAILGCEPAAGPGIPFERMVHPEDRERTRELFATWSRQGLQSATIENRIVDPASGRTHHMIWMVNLAYDQAGNLLELRAIGRDMTEQMLAAQELRTLEQRLLQAQKMEAVGALAGGIAHQFNNILTAIIGNSALADKLIDRHSEAGELVGQIRQAAGRAKTLVHQILTFSRGSDQKRKDLELYQLTQESLVLLREALPPVVTLRADLDADAGMVLGDDSQLRQVIMNLCENACHAMRQEGGALAVGLRPVEVYAQQAASNPDLRPGPYALLTIQDTGPGMDPCTRTRAFEPFFSTEGDPGSGMGLPVVYGIIKAHQGAITVESKPGAGTTVSVYLPRQPGAGHHCAFMPGERSGQGEHILVVDDEKALVALCCRLLFSLGYRATGMTTSFKALERFRKDPPFFDLVLTDLVMPGLSGLRLHAEIKRLQPRTPVIICTGSTDVLDQQSARALGFHSLLLKPYSPRQLASVVSEALGHASSTLPS